MIRATFGQRTTLEHLVPDYSFSGFVDFAENLYPNRTWDSIPIPELAELFKTYLEERGVDFTPVP